MEAFLFKRVLLSLAKGRQLCDIVPPINISKEHLLQQVQNLFRQKGEVGTTANAHE